MDESVQMNGQGERGRRRESGR